MSHRKINIQTITPTYDVIEDRIRLSINHKDINNRLDFMMTRSFILKLLPSYDEFVLKVHYDEMQKTTNKQESQQKSSRLHDHSKLESYQLDADLLHGIQFSYLSERKLTLLKFNSKKVEASVMLDYQALNNLINIIKLTIPYFDWSISPQL